MGGKARPAEIILEPDLSRCIETVAREEFRRGVLRFLTWIRFAPVRNFSKGAVGPSLAGPIEGWWTRYGLLSASFS